MRRLRSAIEFDDRKMCAARDVADAEIQARKMQTDTVMNASRERQMAVRVALDLQRLRILENRGVAVRAARISAACHVVSDGALH